MDDLTRIKGIGRATAERLSQAGVGSFAALAAADPAALAAHEALRGVRASPADIPAWIAGAAELAAAAPQTDPQQAHNGGPEGAGATGGPNPGAAAPITTGMVRRLVRSPIDLSGTRLEIGAEVELPPDVAAELDAAGATEIDF